MVSKADYVWHTTLHLIERRESFIAMDVVEQLSDATDGIAGFRDEGIVNVEVDLVTRADVDLIEDERSLLLSEVGGRPIGSIKKVARGAVGFRVRREIPRRRPLTVHWALARTTALVSAVKETTLRLSEKTASNRVNTSSNHGG